MRINWGTGIVLAFIGFISFILFFVVKMNTDKKYDHQLVTEEYYEKELKYQDEIDKLKNGLALEENVSYTRTAEGLLIRFPEAFDVKHINGKVFLYRPSNEQLDFEIPLSLSNHNLLIPDKRLLDGHWNISVDWEYEGTEYLYKKEIVY